MTGTLIALAEANDDVCDALLLVAVILFAIAAVMSLTKNAVVAGIGYAGLAFVALAGMFISGP